MRPRKPRLVVPCLDETEDTSDEYTEWDEKFSAVSARLILGDSRDSLPPPEEEFSQKVTTIVVESPLVGKETLKYTPLLSGQIRLFRLYPQEISKAQDPSQRLIRGTLEHHYLSDHPQYYALSYCWGSDSNMKPISVNGEIVLIYRNLEAALLQLQSHRGDMLLWADRLCINQRDDDEKTVQVQQMRHIYTDASLVFAWLGEAANDSDLIMDHIRVMGEDICPGNRGMLETKGQLDRLILAHKTAESRKAIANAFKHFSLREYWQRLWIIQEYALAQEVVIVCGDRRITCQDLFSGVSFMQHTLYYLKATNSLIGTIPQEELSTIIEGIIQTYSSAKPSFMQGLTTMRERHLKIETRKSNHFFRVLTLSLVLEEDYNQPRSTDPRDRIFATLGLANNASDYPMLPDYTHNWQHAYTELALALLRQGQIDILSFCQTAEPNPLLAGKDPLPSWVPDWNLRLKYPNVCAPWTTYFTASLDSTDLQAVQVDRALSRISLLGVTIDTITAIGSLWNPDWLAAFDRAGALRFISEVERFCKMSTHFLVTTRATDEVVGRTCIADRICCEGSRTWWQDTEVYVGGYCTCYAKARKALEEGAWPDEVEYCRRVKLLHSRVPFITGTGLVGLAPVETEVGDEVCLFLGGKTPYVVSGEVDGSRKLRGEAYVYGIMYGEFWKHCDDPDIDWIVLD